MKRSSEARFNVHAVRLDPAVLSVKKFREKNPAYIEGKPCVYVGMTGLTPEQRFDNHRRGYKSNRFVREFGEYLMRRKFRHLNPMSYERACAMEVELARRLRSRGFAVWQG